MINQTTKSGLLINEGDEIVTITTVSPLNPKDVHMKYVINETTGWYCSGSRLKTTGVEITLSHTLFYQYSELYLNDCKATEARLRHVSDRLFFEEGQKISTLKFYLDTLVEDGVEPTNQRVLEEAKYVSSLFFESGHALNNDILSENKRVRLKAKNELKKLKIFIADCEQ